MHPQLRAYFDFVWPLFWPWLVWNLLRVARWHTETGRDALIAVDRFGNIRFVRMADPPPPDDLYSYDAPHVPRWERPALASDLPEIVSSILAGFLHTAPACLRRPSGVFPACAAASDAQVRGPP